EHGGVDVATCRVEVRLSASLACALGVAVTRCYRQVDLRLRTARDQPAGHQFDRNVGVSVAVEVGIRCQERRLQLFGAWRCCSTDELNRHGYLVALPDVPHVEAGLVGHGVCWHAGLVERLPALCGQFLEDGGERVVI